MKTMIAGLLLALALGLGVASPIAYAVGDFWHATVCVCLALLFFFSFLTYAIVVADRFGGFED